MHLGYYLRFSVFTHFFQLMHVCFLCISQYISHFPYPLADRKPTTARLIHCFFCFFSSPSVTPFVDFTFFATPHTTTAYSHTRFSTLQPHLPVDSARPPAIDDCQNVAQGFNWTPSYRGVCGDTSVLAAVFDFSFLALLHFRNGMRLKFSSVSKQA